MFSPLLKKLLGSGKKPPSELQPHPSTHTGRSIVLGDQSIPIENKYSPHYSPSGEGTFVLITQVIDPKTKECKFKIQDVRTKKIYLLPSELFRTIFVKV